MAEQAPSVRDRLLTREGSLSPAEIKVAQHIRDNREAVLVSSAAAIAARVGTSDATVVRTAKSLGFSGLDDLRRKLADELRTDLSLAGRIARTVDELGDGEADLFGATLDLQRQSLDRLGREVSAGQFAECIAIIETAKRVAIFGIGPSSAMADYFAIQASRLGIEVKPIVHTGLLLADDLLGLRQGDVLLILAYGRVYPELTAMIDHARSLTIPIVLMTDSLGSKLGKAVTMVLNIPRGRVDLFSMHSATLAFLEALIVGLAAERSGRAIAELQRLNGLRSALTRRPMDL